MFALSATDFITGFPWIINGKPLIKLVHQLNISHTLAIKLIRIVGSHWFLTENSNKKKEFKLN